MAYDADKVTTKLNFELQLCRHGLDVTSLVYFDWQNNLSIHKYKIIYIYMIMLRLVTNHS